MHENVKFTLHAKVRGPKTHISFTAEPKTVKRKLSFSSQILLHIFCFVSCHLKERKSSKLLTNINININKLPTKNVIPFWAINLYLSVVGLYTRCFVAGNNIYVRWRFFFWYKNILACKSGRLTCGAIRHANEPIKTHTYIHKACTFLGWL